ncbi:vWA domain-containing protein [Microbacterium sp.]|uniref:vWA domain-containing protein n=1 Tax=Microbacterium sp. TaxID=51671 RepID=UPI0039E67A5B
MNTAVTSSKLPHRQYRIGALLAALLFCLISSAVPTWASSTDESSTQSVVPTMLILDASSSMLATDGDDSGSTRMAVAKTAALGLVDSLDDDAQLGLLVYGATVPDTASADEGCADVSVVVPVGAGNASELRSGVEATEASGWTPIGSALQAAADALPSDGAGAIVLVSDGIDTCAPPPPCDVAEELTASGVDLTVYTIGFRVDAEARADLQCIADATGGAYSDAQDGEDLAEQLTVRATRALEGYEVSGTPITGGESLAAATEITPGQFLDTFEHGASDTEEGTTKYYRIELAEGERLHVSATAVPPPGDSGAVGGLLDAQDDAYFEAGVDILDAHGESCSADTPWSIQTGGGFSSSFPALSGVRSRPVGEDEDWENQCDAGAVYIRVERFREALADIELPVELVVAIEPADLDTSGTPAEASENPGAEASTTPVEDVELGRSFASAPTLEPGSYAIEMVPGDLRALTIDVAEGQTLSWSVEVVEPADGDLDAYEFVTLLVSTFNPIRENVGGSTSILLDRTGFTGGGMVAPVQLANLESGTTAVSQTWLGGPQTMLLAYSTTLQDPPEGEQVPVRFVLTLAVDGEAGENPQLITEVDPPDNTSIDQTPAAVATTSANTDAGGGIRPLAALAAGTGVVAVGAGAAGVWLLRRRRSAG